MDLGRLGVWTPPPPPPSRRRWAGPDHVCSQPLHPDGAPLPDVRVLEALAPGRR